MAAAGVAGVVVVLLGGYKLVTRGPHTIPVIEAPAGPVRVKPDNPGGMQIVGANEEIMGGAGGGQADHMAPPPEVPQPQALRAEIAAAQPDETPAQPVALTAPPPAASTAIDSVPDTPTPAQPTPPARTQAVPPRHAAAAPAPARPVPAPQAAPATGGAQVQLAAVDSQQAALSEWDRLSKRLPDLFRQHRPDVQRADLGGKTFYRLRTGGFATIATATEFCAQVRSNGAGCSIASF